MHSAEAWSPFMHSQVFKPYYVIPVELSSNPVELVEQRLYIKQLLLLNVCSFEYLIGWDEVAWIAAFLIQVRTAWVCFQISRFTLWFEGFLWFFFLINLITQVWSWLIIDSIAYFPWRSYSYIIVRFDRVRTIFALFFLLILESRGFVRCLTKIESIHSFEGFVSAILIWGFLVPFPLTACLSTTFAPSNAHRFPFFFNWV